MKKQFLVVQVENKNPLCEWSLETFEQHSLSIWNEDVFSTELEAQKLIGELLESNPKCVFSIVQTFVKK